ncbi:predicted protein [Lichtheimia corymbifera JMRC:FSU:9682]|uniref:Uncharacterized protein n=1 Tax=Lichtheimia corymbifera JMRC:FSU:9682 TaxID=1263082 RepID=A0A068SDK1_9FUNG|nr:predicted protein [Lichtheimia corymbifera JMRC:FSU:9682]
MIRPFIKSYMVDVEDRTLMSPRNITITSTQYSKMLDHFISSIHHDNNSHAHSHINKAVVTNTIIRPSFLLVCIPWPLLTSLFYHLKCSLLPNDVWLCSLMDPSLW